MKEEKYLCACCDNEAPEKKFTVRLCQSCAKKIEDRAVKRGELDRSNIEQENEFWGL